MSMTLQDDRTDGQMHTHIWGVVARDKFMSGWGGAKGGYSRCAWACAPDADLTQLEKWVRGRSEMQYVNVVDLRTYRAPRGTVHFHIYVCDREHVSQPLGRLYKAQREARVETERAA
jgi:hypothetical protein